MHHDILPSCLHDAQNPGCPKAARLRLLSPRGRRGAAAGAEHVAVLGGASGGATGTGGFGRRPVRGQKKWCPQASIWTSLDKCWVNDHIFHYISGKHLGKLSQFAKYLGNVYEIIWNYPIFTAHHGDDVPYEHEVAVRSQRGGYNLLEPPKMAIQVIKPAKDGDWSKQQAGSEAANAGTS